MNGNVYLSYTHLLYNKQLRNHHNKRLSAFSEYDKYSKLVSFILTCIKSVILRSKTTSTKNSSRQMWMTLWRDSQVLYIINCCFLKITASHLTVVISTIVVNQHFIKNKCVFMVFEQGWIIVLIQCYSGSSVHVQYEYGSAALRDTYISVT